MNQNVETVSEGGRQREGGYVTRRASITTPRSAGNVCTGGRTGDAQAFEAPREGSTIVVPVNNAQSTKLCDRKENLSEAATKFNGDVKA
jgi:hypothetical protein